MFTKMIDGSRIIVNENGCWVWLGYKTSEGYGRVRIGDGNEYVHRLMYQLFKGPIYRGLEIDHLCRNRACVNPEHLEMVTSRENSLRGNHPLFAIHRSGKCHKGHELTPENSISNGKGGRRCRTCAIEYSRQYYRRKRCTSSLVSNHLPL